MATYYPKASISIRATDAQLNNKTFSVGYVNGEASDGTLRALAQKITELSELSLSQVYKTEQDNITNASTDNTVFTLADSSPFASTDPAVFRAAVEDLYSADMGNITFQVNADNAAVIAVSDLKTWASSNQNFNVETFANVINQRLFNPQTGEKLATFSASNGAYHWDFRNADADTYIIQILASDSGAYEFIDSLYDGATDKRDFSGSQGSRSYSADFTKRG